jgi:hypothetical protein
MRAAYNQAASRYLFFLLTLLRTLLLLILTCTHVGTLAVTHRSSKLAFDEKADSDIRGMLDDFHVCLEELSLDTYEIAFDVGSSNEDSQLSCDCSSE